MTTRVQRKSLLALAAGILAAGVLPAGAHAASITSGNSSLTINPSGSAPYVSQWVVDGVNQFGGTPVGGDSIQFFNGSSFVGVNTLNLASSNFTGPVGLAVYTGVFDGYDFSITVQDTLSGGTPGSGASAINESITVSNLGLAQVPQVRANIVSTPTFTIQDLVDYNVNGTATNDTLTLSPSPTPNTAVQTDPTGAEITYISTPPTTWELISNGSSSMTLGPETGNEAFALDWQLPIAPGNSSIISITETASGINSPPTSIPLPSAAWECLSTLGGLVVFGLAKRVKKAIA
jgi:hypothetical protein